MSSTYYVIEAFGKLKKSYILVCVEDMHVEYYYVTQLFTFSRRNKRVVEELSKPASNAKDLWFPTQYSQNFFSQVSSCLWKQRITYWRNPKFNNTRIVYTVVCGLAIGTIFWGIGPKR